MFGKQRRDEGSSHRGEEEHVWAGKTGCEAATLDWCYWELDATGSEGGVCLYGPQEDGEGASQPYLARSLLVGGGVTEGEAENSPGCSGMGASMGGA